MGTLDGIIAGGQPNMAQDVNELAPLAGEFHVGGDVNAPTNQVLGKTAYTPTGFWGTMENLGKETFNVAETAAKFVGHTLETAVTAPFKYVGGLSAGIQDNIKINEYSHLSQQLQQQTQTLMNSYRAGKISRADYTAEMNNLTKQSSDLVGQNTALIQKIGLDKKQAIDATINTGADVLMLVTGGASGVLMRGVDSLGSETLSKLAATNVSDYLLSRAASPVFNASEALISRVTADSAAFKALDNISQWAVQKSTAEVVKSAAANMTAGQIVRASAVNLALKYPLIFSYTSSTAKNLYTELDQNKYGAAVRTLAFNAALALSGGPIGWAASKGGAAVRAVETGLFGKPAFWDELSKYYGDGSADGFTKAITDHMQGMSQADSVKFVKSLNAVAETNIAAMEGDVRAAAYRVAHGMQSSYSFDMKQVTHTEGLQDMLNWESAARLANEEGKRLGLDNIAVGRWDAREKSSIAGAINYGADGEQARLANWQQWKDANPNSAASNNANLDKQIKQIIHTGGSSEDITTAITNIDAAKTVEGFSKKTLGTLIEKGYIPIQPKGFKGFQEGGDKLVTKFTEGDSFFQRAVQPLPVLDYVGAGLTKLGMSPQSSHNLTYMMFQNALGKRIEQLAPDIAALKGQPADSVIRRLANYAHTSKLQIRDLRQLTVFNIKDALGVSVTDARKLQEAITWANLDVPLAVTGLGELAVSASYATPGFSMVMRRFTKLQSALRFTYNPFFKARVVAKTEILSELKGGGIIHQIFAGRWGEVRNIRAALHEGGFLEKPGLLTTSADTEGVLPTSKDMERNITRKLMSAQENSIAGIIDAQAQRLGMDAQTFMSTYPEQVRSTIQAISEYDSKANFLNSPMMRTLNIAFFPLRFDYKVGSAFVKAVSKSDLPTQVAVITGVMKAHDYLNSPQGQAWYAQNADVLGLINYITPLATFADVFSTLQPGHDHSLGNFGELGGLPFGWIPQILDAEGLTHFNQPGMDAKTGQMIPSYVPTTSKGQLAIAIQDFMGALFSYPGAMVGLPSKSSITRTFGLDIAGASKYKDMTLQTPQPNARQQAYATNIGAQPQNPTESIVQPALQKSTGIMVPTVANPVLTAHPRQTSTITKKKKSQFTPELLPGQQFLGQIPGVK